MGTTLQEQRESYEEGDEVYLVTTMGEGLTKRKKATVVDTVRGAIRIQVIGEKTPRLVRFKDVEHVTEKTPKKAPPVVQRPLTLVPPVELATTAAPTEEVAPEPPSQSKKSPIEIWFEMGEQLLEEQQTELAVLDSEEQAIRAEEKDLKEQIEICQALLADIPNRLASVPTRKKKVMEQIEMIKSKLGKT